MDYVTNSFDALLNDDSIIKKALIGTGILFLSILIFPYFIYQGYLLRILKETENGVPDKLPEWTDFGELFKDGVVALLISLVITIPAYVIMYGPMLAGSSESVVLVAQLVGSLISLVSSYLILAILALYARDGMNGATDLTRVKNILFSVEYLIANVVLLVIGGVFGIFLIVFVLFTIGLGILVVPFMIPPINYLYMVIVGSAISEAEGTSSTESR